MITKVIKISSIRTNYFIASILFIALPLLTSCSSNLNEHNPTATTVAKQVPTKTAGTPSPVPQIVPEATEDSIIKVAPDVSILAIYPIPDIGFAGYWSVSHPFDHVQAILEPTQEYAYCCLVEDQVSGSFAFIRRYIPSRSDSLWVMDENGDELHQLLDDASIVVTFGWSPVGDQIYAFSGNVIMRIDAKSGKIEYIPRPSGLFTEYDQMLGLLLLLDEAEDHYIYRLVDLVDLDNSIELVAPPEHDSDFEPYEWHRFSYASRRDLLAIADFSRERGREGLWIVDVQSEEWGHVIDRKVQWIPDFVEWSSDEEYVAWLMIYKSTTAHYFLHLNIIETEHYDVIREIETESIKQFPVVLGWMKDPDFPFFGVFLPDVGIMLYDPQDPSQDKILISYEELKRLFPIDPNDFYWWEWRK